MRSYQPHGHIRPYYGRPFGETAKYVIDFFAGNGQWESAGYADTKEEAQRNMARHLRLMSARREGRRE